MGRGTTTGGSARCGRRSAGRRGSASTPTAPGTSTRPAPCSGAWPGTTSSSPSSRWPPWRTWPPRAAGWRYPSRPTRWCGLDDARRVAALGAADVLVVKVQAAGGVAAGLALAEPPGSLWWCPRWSRRPSGSRPVPPSRPACRSCWPMASAPALCWPATWSPTRSCQRRGCWPCAARRPTRGSLSAGPSARSSRFLTRSRTRTGPGCVVSGMQLTRVGECWRDRNGRRAAACGRLHQVPAPGRAQRGVVARSYLVTEGDGIVLVDPGPGIAAVAATPATRRARPGRCDRDPAHPLARGTGRGRRRPAGDDRRPPPLPPGRGAPPGRRRRRRRHAGGRRRPARLLPRRGQSRPQPRARLLPMSRRGRCSPGMPRPSPVASCASAEPAAADAPTARRSVACCLEPPIQCVRPGRGGSR